jgi:uncharacterized protein (TIGR03437 family)
MRFVVLFAACAAAYGQRLWFEPNQGQAHTSVEFLAHTSKGYVYFAHDKMAVRDVRMDLVGANKLVKAELEDPTGGISSYFIGRSEKDWHTGIPHYGRIRYKNVYAGIDLVYYASGRDIEYDFVLKPGANPNQIKLAYNKPVHIDENGDLLIGRLKQHRPRVFQNQREIECDYLIRDRNQIHLALAAYDRSQSLTVDPVLEFSTYLGGPGEDAAAGVALDSQGFIYVAGSTQTPQSPTLDPFHQPDLHALSPFVIKMSNDGQRVLYFAELSSGAWDEACDVAVGSDGTAVVVGLTESTNFPLKNPLQTTFTAIHWSGFFSKITADGRSLVFSSYYGGSNSDTAYAAKFDSAGNIYIAGQTDSYDFPVRNAVQETPGGGLDMFLLKLTPEGKLLFSTRYGGRGQDTCFALAVAPDGGAIIGGGSSSADFPFKNAAQTSLTPKALYVTPALVRFAPDGSSVVFATFVGGPVDGDIKGVALDTAGNIYAEGYVGDKNFTTKNAFQANLSASPSAFLMKLDPTASNLIYSTYLGGSGGALGSGLAVDASGSAYVTGYAASADFPLKNSLQPFYGGGILNADIFLTKFAPAGDAIIYSTLLGGHGNDFGVKVAIDGAGTAYVVGSTLSNDFPVKNAYQAQYGGGNGDLVLAKISDNTPLAPSPLAPNPGHLSFRYTQGASVPAVQTVMVTGPAFTMSASAPWLVATANGSRVTISVDPTGLAPNAYNASVSLIPQADTPASIDVTLTVLSPAPLLTSIDPVLVPIGSGSTAITIHGSGFTKDSVVLVSGVPYTPVSFIDATTLNFTLPEIYFKEEFNYTIAVKNPTSDPSNVLSVAVGTPPPQFSAAGIVNSASFASGAVAPGEIVTIFGTNLTDKVTFDNIPATLVFASPTQVNVTVPYPVTAPSTMIQVGSSVPVKLDVAPSAPGIFAAVQAGDNILTLYATGCGALTNDDLPRCALPVSVTVNGEPAQVLYAGIAPGLVQGANQINIQLPDSIGSGPVTIVLTAGDASSKPFVWNQP